MNGIIAFAKFMDEVADLLRVIRRWTHYEELPHNERETVESHSLRTGWLMGAMLAIERKVGRHTLDAFRMLMAAGLHDIGEGKMGDVAYAVKNDPRVKKGLQAIEREFVERYFLTFPEEVRDAFLNAYSVESEDTLEGRFFNAVERIGYILFAIPQVQKGRLSFIDVLERHHEPLVKLSEEFKSVEVFYAPYKDFVVGKLAEREARRRVDN